MNNHLLFESNCGCEAPAVSWLLWRSKIKKIIISLAFRNELVNILPRNTFIRISYADISVLLQININYELLTLIFINSLTKMRY